MGAALHCLTWTTLFTLLLWALLQNRSFKCFPFFALLVTSLGPSPQSSTKCHQTFACCTVCLVWLALGAREIPYDWGYLEQTKVILPNSSGFGWSLYFNSPKTWCWSLFVSILAVQNTFPYNLLEFGWGYIILAKDWCTGYQALSSSLKCYAGNAI